MTQSHFITGTTLTLLLAAVAVLGNAPSATADSTDVTDPNSAPGSTQASSENDAVLVCELNELRGDDASTLLDAGVPAEPDDETSELARRVSAALLGQTKPADARVARATKTSNDAATANRVWRCGHWEELWQGRGNARTCEWK